jgi:predicted ribosomally synthesized peptide with nif11-like leader
MSAAGAAALYERVGSDEEFRGQLEAAETPDDKYRIVSQAGYDVSRDDLPTLRKLAGVNELSDEDMEKVAGGGVTTAIAVLGGGQLLGTLVIAAVIL